VYLAIPSFGAVLHTINIRLFPDQVVYIVNHARDGVIFVDGSLVEPLARLAPQFEGVRHYVVMGDGDLDALPGALSYEDLLAEAGDGDYAWPSIDERAAAALCYTSGTTGNPKGVLYSHRSVSLHSTAICMADAVGLSSRDRVLAIVPMFHVNAWGLPFGAALTGAALHMPGPFLQAEPLARFIEEERPTLLAGVPTVLGALLAHVDAHGGDLSSLRSGICGGSAVPRSLMEGYERHGVHVWHAWGMTETSPILTVARPPAGVDAGEEYWHYRSTQGRLVPWAELRLSEGTNEIEARGPWVAARYFEDPSGDDKFTDDGWLRTGDIGEMDERGYVRITDRAKDLIKSGGEWISSVEVETLLVDHPSVIEAAVIAMPDDRWGERPLACVALAEGTDASPSQLREHLSSGLASWQLPDAFAFIPEVPKTSVGKFDKKALRRALADGDLAIVRDEAVR
jgi:fatty-acyl-CoA synthase